MAIFKKPFTDTIILKSENQLEKSITKLEELTKKYPKNQEIQKDLFLAKLGLAGENEILYELKNSNIGMYVLHDIHVVVDDFEAQIDFVIITKAHVYFIESKNLIGNITVNNNGDFIREYVFDSKKIKTGMYSPIRQVERQLDIFKKHWLSKRSKLEVMLFEKAFDDAYKVLAVLAKKENILDTRFAPKDVKDKVFKSDALIKKLENDISNKKEHFSQKDMEKIITSILALHVEKEMNYEEKYKLNTTSLRDELINFRTKTAKEKNIPAYFIFSNEELENLLNTKPKTLEELKTQRILPAIKINSHGKELIEIIKNFS